MVRVGQVHLHRHPGVGRGVQHLRNHRLGSLHPLFAPTHPDVGTLLAFGSNLQPGRPDDAGVGLSPNPLEELSSHLAKFWRVHHHQLQLPSVHAEPLLILKLLLALGVDVVPGGFPGEP